MNSCNKPLCRILTIVVSISLVIAAIAVPASASTYEDRWVNVLDYATANNSGSNGFALTTGGTVSYTLPSSHIVQDIDIVFRCNRGVNDVSVVLNASKSFKLNLQAVGDGIYRAWGNCSAYGFTTIQLKFTLGTTVESYFDMLQFRISSQNSDFYHVPATISKSTSVSGPSSHSAGSDTTAFTFTSTGEWSLNVAVSEWVKYDYINFAFSSKNIVVGSISAYIGDRSVDVNIESFDGDPYGSYTDMITGFLDIRGIEKHYSNDLVIALTGTCTSTSGSQLWLSWLNGSVSVVAINPFIYFFTTLGNTIKNGFASVGQWFTGLIDNLGDWFDSVLAKLDEFINGSEEQQQAAEDFKENANEQSSAISGAVDAMDVDRSEINTDVSVSGITGGLDFSYFNSAMLTVTSSSTVYQLLIMTAALMLVSYVLFGKKI